MMYNPPLNANPV